MMFNNMISIINLGIGRELGMDGLEPYLEVKSVSVKLPAKY